ncbi:MAG: ATP-binding protein [Anaerolineaceae bacterium]
MSHQKTLYLMIGLPGAGKSTLVSRILRVNPTLTVLSTDNFIEEVAEREGKTYSEVFKDAIGDATRNLEETKRKALEEGADVIWDQTNLTRKKRNSITRVFRAAGYRIEYYLILVEEKRRYDWYKRLDCRPNKKVPRKVIKTMTHHFQMPESDVEDYDGIRVYDIDGNLIYKE